MQILKKNGGFSLAEVLIVIALLGILASVVLLNLGSSDVKAKESNLQSNAETLRTALDLFRSDHGFYPGQTGDTDSGAGLTADEFKQKLTRYSSTTGATSTTKSTTYKYGPYLREFPDEPFTDTQTIDFDTSSEQDQGTMTAAVAADAGATGGWHYEILTGQICAHLGTAYPTEYAGF